MSEEEDERALQQWGTEGVQNGHAQFFRPLHCKAIMSHLKRGSFALGPGRLVSRKAVRVDSWSQPPRLVFPRRCPPMPPHLLVVRINVASWNDNNVLRAMTGMN